MTGQDQSVFKPHVVFFEKNERPVAGWVKELKPRETGDVYVIEGEDEKPDFEILKSECYDTIQEKWFPNEIGLLRTTAEYLEDKHRVRSETPFSRSSL